MVLVELVEHALGFIADFVGLDGLAIGGLAVAVVGLHYLREVADVFVVLSRYARMLSYVLGVLLVVLVVGTHYGIVDVDSGGSLIGQLLGAAEGFL